MEYTVGDVSKTAHVSIRTLHHYDELGLLAPSRRTAAGYRLYSDEDLLKLQQILFYKELGFELDEIRSLMADPEFDRREALVQQRKLIAEQATRLGAMLGLIDRTLETLDRGDRMSKEEMFEVFGDFDPEEYEDEARQRWGETDAYKESARRSKRYTKEDWKRFADESEAISLAIADLMDAGVPPTDPRAMDAVDRHRQLIDRWFYPCSPDLTGLVTT
ncbi:MAG: MerR family transcriptional regulator [Coriobacteriia bacterium]